MQPDLDLSVLFPGSQPSGALSERDLATFAGFWDDEASDEENLGAIGWWLARAHRLADTSIGQASE